MLRCSKTMNSSLFSMIVSSILSWVKGVLDDVGAVNFTKKCYFSQRGTGNSCFIYIAMNMLNGHNNRGVAS